MKRRATLKSQIVKAWRSCIAKDYPTRRINSERSLQASFWSRLNRRLPANRLMFIEPRVVAPAGGGQAVLYPDIVICNSRQVIGVIELKYLPRTKPSHAKDINSLATIAECRKGIVVVNERYRGEGPDGKEFTISDHVLFVWGGVHAAEQSGDGAAGGDLFAEGKQCLEGCYLELHAATHAGQKPDIYWHSSPAKRPGK